MVSDALSVNIVQRDGSIVNRIDRELLIASGGRIAGGIGNIKADGMATVVQRLRNGILIISPGDRDGFHILTININLDGLTRFTVDLERRRRSGGNIIVRVEATIRIHFIQLNPGAGIDRNQNACRLCGIARRIFRHYADGIFTVSQRSWVLPRPVAFGIRRYRCDRFFIHQNRNRRPRLSRTMEGWRIVAGYVVIQRA